MNKFNLIGLNFCPFIQPIIITLIEKGVKYNITYIQLGDKSDWLHKLSPNGITPFLTFNDRVLFESFIINDFIDEITAGSLYPEDSFLKAKNRVWIKYSYDVLERIYELKTAKKLSSFKAAREKLIGNLQSLEEVISDTTYFNGEQFCLVDGAYAPVFRNITMLDKHFASGILDALPDLKRWSDNILCRDSVKASVVNDFEQVTLNRIAASDSVLSRVLFQSTA